MNETIIPIKQTSNYFGTLNKVIWFDVPNTKGIFTINLYIRPNQISDMNVIIFNKGSNQELYNKTYNKTSNSSTITESFNIMHIPNERSTIYGIKSL